MKYVSQRIDSDWIVFGMNSLIYKLNLIKSIFKGDFTICLQVVFPGNKNI